LQQADEHLDVASAKRAADVERGFVIGNRVRGLCPPPSRAGKFAAAMQAVCHVDIHGAFRNTEWVEISRWEGP
jgi:hypothetical protein